MVNITKCKKRIQLDSHQMNELFIYLNSMNWDFISLWMHLKVSACSIFWGRGMGVMREVRKNHCFDLCRLFLKANRFSTTFCIQIFNALLLRCIFFSFRQQILTSLHSELYFILFKGEMTRKSVLSNVSYYLNN